MKRLIVAAFSITCVCTLAADGGGAKNELEKLRGTWNAVGYEIGGVKIEGNDLKAVLSVISIKGDAFEWTASDNDASRGKIKIDTSKNPSHIDFIAELEGIKVVSWSGIYALSGDTLKFCVAPGMAERPKDFSAKSVTHGVFTLKRTK